MVVMSLWDELRVRGGSLYAVCIQMTGLYFHYSFNVLEGQSDHLERPRSKSITFVRQILRRAPCRRNGCFRVGAAEADGGSLCSRAALITSLVPYSKKVLWSLLPIQKKGNWG